MPIWNGRGLLRLQAAGERTRLKLPEHAVKENIHHHHEADALCEL